MIRRIARRVAPIALAFCIIAAFGWTLVFLYGKSKEQPVIYKTATAEVRDIVQKTVAAGSIVPRRASACGSQSHITGTAVSPGASRGAQAASDR